MGFMEKQIEHANFYLVETSCGTVCIPSDLVRVISENDEGDELVLGIGESVSVNDDDIRLEEWNQIVDCVSDFVDGEVFEVSYATGYIGRLSAPGYMDCTDWVWGDSEQEVSEILDDMYGED